MKTKLYVILICIFTLVQLTSCTSADSVDKKDTAALSADVAETKADGVESAVDTETAADEEKADTLAELLPEEYKELFESYEAVSLWFSFSRGYSNEGILVDDHDEVSALIDKLMKAEVTSCEEIPVAVGSKDSVQITFDKKADNSADGWVAFEITESGLELRSVGIRYTFAEHPLKDYLGMIE